MSNLRCLDKIVYYAYSFVDNSTEYTLSISIVEGEERTAGDIKVYYSSVPVLDIDRDVLEFEIAYYLAHELLDFIQDSYFAEHELTVQFLEQAIEFLLDRDEKDPSGEFVSLYDFSRDYKRKLNAS